MPGPDHAPAIGCQMSSPRRLQRARVKASMNQWKQVIGDELRAHTDERRNTEVAVAVHALNRMLELGRPSYVRVA